MKKSKTANTTAEVLFATLGHAVAQIKYIRPYVMGAGSIYTKGS